MGQPLFLLQIVRSDDGKVATFPGGTQLERDLVEICTARILAQDLLEPCRLEIAKQSLGVFRTQAQAEQAVTDGLWEALPLLEARIRAGIEEALAGIKEETRALVYKAPL